MITTPRGHDPTVHRFVVLAILFSDRHVIEHFLLDRARRFALPLAMTHLSRSQELEHFKQKINLCEYMSTRGFQLDRRQSSRCSAVLRHPSGEKLVVAKAKNQNWIYFNVHDDRDKGSILDFIQYRDKISLGEVRKVLRSFRGDARLHCSPARVPFVELAPSERDHSRVVTAWIRAKPLAADNAYLRNERMIPSRVLTDPIFANRIRVDSRRNLLFGHWNRDGLCGFEVKNCGFTGFAPGGVKALHHSKPRVTDRELIICETAIDMLSVAAIRGTHQRRFMSTAGQVSPAQLDLIQSAAKKMPTGSRIVLSTDNDRAGRQLADTLRTALPEAGLPDDHIAIELPAIENQDFNDVLKRSATPKPASPIVI